MLKPVEKKTPRIWYFVLSTAWLCHSYVSVHECLSLVYSCRMTQYMSVCYLFTAPEWLRTRVSVTCLQLQNDSVHECLSLVYSCRMTQYMSVCNLFTAPEWRSTWVSVTCVQLQNDSVHECHIGINRTCMVTSWWLDSHIGINRTCMVTSCLVARQSHRN